MRAGVVVGAAQSTVRVRNTSADGSGSSRTRPKRFKRATISPAQLLLRTCRRKEQSPYSFRSKTKSSKVSHTYKRVAEGRERRLNYSSQGMFSTKQFGDLRYVSGGAQESPR